MDVRKLAAAGVAVVLAATSGATPAEAQRHGGGYQGQGRGNWDNNSMRRGDGYGVQRQRPYATAYDQYNTPLFRCVAEEVPYQRGVSIQVLGADPYQAFPEMTMLRTRDGTSTGANADSRGMWRYANTISPYTACDQAFRGYGLRNERLAGFSGSSNTRAQPNLSQWDAWASQPRDQGNQSNQGMQDYGGPSSNYTRGENYDPSVPGTISPLPELPPPPAPGPQTWRGFSNPYAKKQPN